MPFYLYTSNKFIGDTNSRINHFFLKDWLAKDPSAADADTADKRPAENVTLEAGLSDQSYKKFCLFFAKCQINLLELLSFFALSYLCL